jgi:hypothetical protein
MTPVVEVDDKVYEYALKHSLTRGRLFYKREIVYRMATWLPYRKAPKYFRDGIACDGYAFRNLREMLLERFWLCCRDSDDGTFRVGDVVYRNSGKDQGFAGITIRQTGDRVEADRCDVALQGAKFLEYCGDVRL